MEIHTTLIFLLLMYSGKVNSDFTFLVNICVSKTQFCMGALIDTQWVVTAAHCVVNDGALASHAIEVKMGLTYPQVRHIDKILPHQGYHPQTKLDDIALVKLNEPFRLSTEVTTVELDRINIDRDGGVMVTVASWGSTEEADTSCMSGDLSILTIPLMSASNCKKTYSSIIYNNHFLNNKVNCAGSYGHNSCNGDEGSPVVYDNILIAIVSLNAGCKQNQPSLNVKVAYYSQWIDLTRKMGVHTRSFIAASTMDMMHLRFIFLSTLFSITYSIYYK